MKRNAIAQSQKGREILAKNKGRTLYVSDLDQIHDAAMRLSQEKGRQLDLLKVMEMSYYFGVYQGYEQRRSDEKKKRSAKEM